MPIVLDYLRRATTEGRFRVTDHADEEAAADELVLDEIVGSLGTGEIIEQYPTDRPFPSCLVLGWNDKHEPIHSVWAYNEENERAILVTVYRPDPTRWIDFRIRKPRHETE